MAPRGQGRALLVPAPEETHRPAQAPAPGLALREGGWPGQAPAGRARDGTWAPSGPSRSGWAERGGPSPAAPVAMVTFIGSGAADTARGGGGNNKASTTAAPPLRGAGRPRRHLEAVTEGRSGAAGHARGSDTRSPGLSPSPPGCLRRPGSPAVNKTSSSRGRAGAAC